MEAVGRVCPGSLSVWFSWHGQTEQPCALELVTANTQLLKKVWSILETFPSVSRQRRTCKFADMLLSMIIAVGDTYCTACKIVAADCGCVKMDLKPVFTLYMLLAALRARRVAMAPRVSS